MENRGGGLKLQARCKLQWLRYSKKFYYVYCSQDSIIDPELDVMLAELETDDDFQKMSDNEQVCT